MLAKGLTWNTRHAGTAPTDEFGYMVFRLNYGGKTYHLKAHAIAYALMTGSADVPEIDHRNVSESDNRIRKSRPATRSRTTRTGSGGQNRGFRKGFTSGTENSSRAALLRADDADRNVRDSRRGPLGLCAWARPLHGEFFNAGPEKSSVFD